MSEYIHRNAEAACDGGVARMVTTSVTSQTLTPVRVREWDWEKARKDKADID